MPNPFARRIGSGSVVEMTPRRSGDIWSNLLPPCHDSQNVGVRTDGPGNLQPDPPAVYGPAGVNRTCWVSRHIEWHRVRDVHHRKVWGGTGHRRGIRYAKLRG